MLLSYDAAACENLRCAHLQSARKLLEGLRRDGHVPSAYIKLDWLYLAG